MAAGVNRLSIGVQSMADHVLAALGREHLTPTTCGGRPRRPTALGWPSTSTSSTAPEANGRGLGRDRRRGGAAGAGPRQRLRPDGGGRHAAGRRPRPPPRRRRPGRTSTSWPPSGWPAAATSGTRSRTGPGPATGAATTSCTGPGRVPRDRLRRPQPPRRAPVLERAHSRALRGRGRGRPLPEAGGERLDPPSRRLEGLQLALRTDAGVPADVSPPESAGRAGRAVVADPDRGWRASPAGPAVWPTRWRCACRRG